MTDPRIAELIRALADDAGPVVPLPPVATRARRWLLLAVVAVALGVLALGPRHDIATALASPTLPVQLVLLATTSVLASVAALRLAIPGADRRGGRLAALALLAAWPVGLLTRHVTSGGTASDVLTEPWHPACAVLIASVAVVPGVVLARMVRQGAPLMPSWAAAMAGLAAAAAGASAVSVICPIGRDAHLLVAHALPAWGLTLLAVMVAGRLLAPAGRRIVLLLGIAFAVSATTVAHAAMASASTALPAFSVSATTGGYIDSDAMLEFLARSQAGAPTSSPFAGQAPLLVGLAILVGGLLLNLTPCVLPMIPINLSIIGAGRAAVSRRRGLLLGGAYGAAMALVYGTLGGLIVATTGTFGAVNASPWFNAGIAVLFVVLGLAMFDVVTLDFSRWSSRVPTGTAARGSVTLAFVMGGVAALLAGACVAPVVIQVIALASERHAAGSRAALALPLLLGIGMGLPWPLAGAGLAALPRPGAWMVRVKQVLGATILLSAAWYAYEAAHLFRPSAPQAGLIDGWHQSLDDALADARRQDKPVFVDVWATWCKNCTVMDATTFKDARVRDALADYVKVRVQAEDVEAPDTAALLDRLDSVGLPTYAVIRPAPVGAD